MHFAVEKDLALDPMNIGLFGAERVMQEAKLGANPVEQFGFLLRGPERQTRAPPQHGRR